MWAKRRRTTEKEVSDDKKGVDKQIKSLKTAIKKQIKKLETDLNKQTKSLKLEHYTKVSTLEDTLEKERNRKQTENLNLGVCMKCNKRVYEEGKIEDTSADMMKLCDGCPIVQCRECFSEFEDDYYCSSEMPCSASFCGKCGPEMMCTRKCMGMLCDTGPLCKKCDSIFDIKEHKGYCSEYCKDYTDSKRARSARIFGWSDDESEDMYAEESDDW